MTDTTGTTGTTEDDSDLPRPDYALLDRAGAAHVMFYPRPEAYPPPPGATEHMLEVDARDRVAARFYGANPGWPSVLYFHGNGEIASDYDDIASFYHDSRLNLFVADFRGYGASTGTPTVAALFADAHPTARGFHAVLDARGFTARRYVMGRSLGAHPALELAARAPEGFAGLIIESGAGVIRRSLERYGLLDTELGGLLARAHEAKLRAIRLPALLIHGAMDDLVPLASATELYGLLEDAPARHLEVIPRAGHNDIMWTGQARYFAAIEEFVARTSGLPTEDDDTEDGA